MVAERRECGQCTRRVTGRSVYCSPACKQRAYRTRKGLESIDAGTPEFDYCVHCMQGFHWTRSRAGQTRYWCSNRCSQAARRARQAEERWREEQRRQEEERRRWEEHQARERERARERARRQRTSSSSGSGSDSGAYRRTSNMGTAEARRILFRLAGLADDGTVTLKTAHRRAAKSCHPDAHPGREEDFKLLERAASILRDAGLL
ncbi:J domain-containing protein [Streptomyces sp. NPDC096136]|uniref:J domain-containing protein n=1 Tax=Streptomyces sp. NPDC096136 TaxID=3366076 RepID=UPI00380374FE